MIQSINHVTYSVSDIKASITFYKDILKAICYKIINLIDRV